MNPFSISELFKAANQNPRLGKPFIISKHTGARYLRAKARITKRRAKR